jgi:hypothetical protein
MVFPVGLISKLFQSNAKLCYQRTWFHLTVVDLLFFNSGGPHRSRSLHQLLHVFCDGSTSSSMQFLGLVENMGCQFLWKLGRCSVLHGSPHRM